jgi:RNA polymerase sporulation-specific sigma factor
MHINLHKGFFVIIENYIIFLHKVLFFAGAVASKSSFPKPLSKIDEENYIRAFHAGDLKAKDILIRHNLRLVAHVVKKYNGSAEADDLLSSGTIGLIKAVNTFKLDKGTQISTYAARCIENEILMFLRVNKKHQNIASLNETFNMDDGDDVCLVDIIADEAEDRIETAEHQILMSRLVAEMRLRLEPREYEIIALRYGIETNITMPQREVAHKMNISRSYISRIEKRAIEIIREIAQKPEFNGIK